MMVMEGEKSEKLRGLKRWNEGVVRFWFLVVGRGRRMWYLEAICGDASPYQKERWDGMIIAPDERLKAGRVALFRELYKRDFFIFEQPEI